MYKNSFNVSSSIHFTSKSYINILPSAELLPTTLLPNQVYLYIYIYPIKSVNTLRRQTYPILLSSRQPDVFAHLPAKWVAQHAQNLPWNWWLKSSLQKAHPDPIETKPEHTLSRLSLTVPRTSTSLCSLPIMTCIGILYIHISECILMLILCQNKTAADMKHCRKPLKPLSTLPEEIHISKFEDL